MIARRSVKRALCIWAVAIATVISMISTALPWLAERGYAGRVIQENVRHDRDASALFYTEHERTAAVLRDLANRR